jgi:4'-phosphopantetheinyl transferase
MAEKAPLPISLLKKPSGADEIHIHIISLIEEHPEYIHFLDEVEMERARRFHSEIDTRRFIASHGALRRILAAYLGTDPNRIRYKQGIHGKPMLDDGIFNSSLRFNISHSGDLGVIVVANGIEVGIDIEQICEEFPIGEIANRFFSSEEQQYLRNSHNPLKSFFMLWTRKEAYIKGTGEGLNVRLDGIDVTSNESHRLVSSSSAWSIVDITLPDGYAGALAIHGNLNDIRFMKMCYGFEFDVATFERRL